MHVYTHTKHTKTHTQAEVVDEEDVCIAVLKRTPENLLENIVCLYIHTHTLSLSLPLSLSHTHIRTHTHTHTHAYTHTRRQK